MTSNRLSLEELVEQQIDACNGKVGALMPVLHGIQHELGYVPSEAVPLIARGMSLSRAEIQGVIDFYHDFRNQPGGRHTVQVCRAEACQAMGARELEQFAKERLGVEMGGTTEDGLVTLEPVYCLGNCACSPAVRIDQEIHARVSNDRFEELVRELEQPT